MERENGNPLQYSSLGNPMDRGAWRATVHGVTKESDTTQRLKEKERERTWGWRWRPLSDKSGHPSCLLPLCSKEDLEEEQSFTAMMVHQYSIVYYNTGRSQSITAENQRKAIWHLVVTWIIQYCFSGLSIILGVWWTMFIEWINERLCVRAFQVDSVVSTSLQPHGLYSLPGSSIDAFLQSRMLEWVDIPFSRESSRPRDWTLISCVSCIGRWIPYH